MDATRKRNAFATPGFRDRLAGEESSKPVFKPGGGREWREIEWNSARFSRPAVEKAKAAFGPAHVEGSDSHLTIDETEDHYDMMCDVAARLCARSGGSEILVELVRDISALFRRYFEELQAETASAETLVA